MSCTQNSITPKAVALLSGGLDSILAICIAKDLGIEVEAVHFQTMFGCCKVDSERIAHQLGVRFTLLKVGDDYLDVINNPKYGYGRALNPCVDCRIYMFQAAKKFMEASSASFLITGEVLDQRPMSQKKMHFEMIERDCELEGRILRPLCGGLLAPTQMEKEGLINREKLFQINGRTRKKLLKLAEDYGIEDPPSASPGCALTMEPFARKVKDIFDLQPEYQRWEFEILKMGRHFRLPSGIKIILGRNQNENEYLENLNLEDKVLLKPVNFAGPSALICGDASVQNIQQAGVLMRRYARKCLPRLPAAELILSKDRQQVILDFDVDLALCETWRL